MKSFIVAIPLLFILIFFMFQNAADESSHFKRTTINNIVEAHAAMARHEGYFTQDIIDSMKNQIEEDLYIPANEIKIQVTTTPKYKTEAFNPNELIEYKIEVPIKRIIAMAEYVKFDESKNVQWYPIEGAVSSEKLLY